MKKTYYMAPSLQDIPRGKMPTADILNIDYAGMEARAFATMDPADMSPEVLEVVRSLGHRVNEMT